MKPILERELLLWAPIRIFIVVNLTRKQNINQFRKKGNYCSTGNMSGNDLDMANSDTVRKYVMCEKQLGLYGIKYFSSLEFGLKLSDWALRLFSLNSENSCLRLSMQVLLNQEYKRHLVSVLKAVNILHTG